MELATHWQFNRALLSAESSYTCHRQGHQSVVIGMNAYSFGGFQDVGREGLNGTAQTNFGNAIYQAILSSEWHIKTDKNQFKATISNNEPPSSLYNLTGGSLFPGPPGDDNLYLFGGAPYSPLDKNNSLANLTKVATQVWSFDLKKRLWTEANFTTLGPTEIEVSRHGTFAHARDLSVTFYLDVGGLSVLNTSSRTIRNIPATSTSNGRGRFGSNLQYIPGLGRQGALIMFGGAFALRNQTNAGSITDMIPLSSIHVLDIASLENGEGTWYEQNTSGRIPNPRLDACAAMGVAPDNSSYNTYVHGGRSPSGDFDEVWVLTLPYFRWIKVVKGSFPIFGHNCHLVGSKQMLILGGNRYTQVKDKHPCYLGRTGVAIFDMTTLQWADRIAIPDRPYEVPFAIVEWIHGTSKGKANMTKPEGGFVSEGLAKLFGSPSQGGNLTTNSGTTCFSVDKWRKIWHSLVMVLWFSLWLWI